MPNPFDQLAVLAYHLIFGISGAAEPLFGTASAAAAVVLGTVLIRLALVPAAIAQHRAGTRRTALFQRAAALKERQLGPDRLQAELAELYRAEGGGLLRGFLPMLVQLPVFAALYRLFVSPTVGGATNALLHQTLFGVPLGAHLLGAAVPHLLLFAALAALLLALGFASSRLLRPPGPRPAGLLGALGRVLPYTPAAAVLFLPVAASLFVVTTTAWTLAQTLILRGH